MNTNSNFKGGTNNGGRSLKSLPVRTACRAGKLDCLPEQVLAGGYAALSNTLSIVILERIKRYRKKWTFLL